MGFRKVTPEMLEQRKKWEEDLIKPSKLKKKSKWSGKVGYRNYLKSKHWKKRRVRYWRRHEKVCFCCGGLAILLHHITYARNVLHS